MVSSVVLTSSVVISSMALTGFFQTAHFIDNGITTVDTGWQVEHDIDVKLQTQINVLAITLLHMGDQIKTLPLQQKFEMPL